MKRSKRKAYAFLFCFLLRGSLSLFPTCVARGAPCLFSERLVRKMSSAYSFSARNSGRRVQAHFLESIADNVYGPRLRFSTFPDAKSHSVLEGASAVVTQKSRFWQDTRALTASFVHFLRSDCPLVWRCLGSLGT